MRILSLFDGISCGQVALERAGINYTHYFASEIDKYAISITQKNYPNIIQLGDVKQWPDWGYTKPDLLIGGSPCQGFSIAGSRLNWEDERSQLFFDYLGCLRIHKPKYFIYENVIVRKDVRDAMSKELGVEPIMINSSLVSGQHRKRYYWTNIPCITQPDDKHIYLQDILEHGYTDRLKSYCIDASYYKGGNLKSYFEKSRRQLVFERPIRVAHIGNGGQGQRIYAVNGKSVTLSANGGGWGAKTGLYHTDLGFRKLTPIECERLQTLPDNYTQGISDTQRYKGLGNGWTVDVVSHMMKEINNV